jgi:class 3 adenylate cyclase
MTRNVTHPMVAPTAEMAKIAEARAIREFAVMFADIAGSTGLYESLGDARAHRVVAATLQIMTGAVQACGGRIVKTVGDALLCTYPSADDGARGAIAIQQALQGLQQVPDAGRVAVRIGFNCGPVVEAGGDVFGDSVNVAARLVQMARPQQILTTATCIERLSPEHRSKARELQLIGVRGRDSYVAVWELRWRPEEDQTQRLSTARQARTGSLLRLEFRGLGWELWREGDVLTIGRDETSHVRLDGQLASRDHARILVRNGKFVLIDHSTNGTYLLPEGGTTIAMMHEEYVLSGSGKISFGCIAANAGSELARFSSGTRSMPRAARNAESPAERPGAAPASKTP